VPCHLEYIEGLRCAKIAHNSPENIVKTKKTDSEIYYDNFDMDEMIKARMAKQ